MGPHCESPLEKVPILCPSDGCTGKDLKEDIEKFHWQRYEKAATALLTLSTF